MTDAAVNWAKETYGDPRYKDLPYLTDLKMAYSAGVQAERERCAEVAEKQEKQLPSSCHMRDFHAEGYNDAREDIAASIRGQG